MDIQNSTVKQRSCYKCGFHAETANTKCPQCSRPLQTTSSIRIRGSLLVLCGLVLMGIMGYVSVWALTAFSNADSGGARFTGTQQEKMLIVGLFGVLLVFGFVSFVAGLWQLILGRRNRIFVWTVVGLAALIAIGGGAVILLFD